MSTGEQQNIPWFGSHFFNDSIGSIRDLLWRFTTRAAVTEDLPSRAFCPDLDGSATFVLAIVPFDEIAINLSDGSEACDLTGAAGALQWTGKDPGDGQFPKAPSKPASVVFTTRCEW
jgi:hypothetical protein